MSRLEHLRSHVRECLEDVPSEKRRLVSELVYECRGLETRKEVRKHMVRRFAEMGDSTVKFGFFEVIALIRLGIAIWKFFKEMGWLGDTTPQLVEEKLNSDF